MVRVMVLLMLGGFACVNLGCGSPGPPVVPENATEKPAEQLSKEGNTASMALEE